MPIRCSFGRFVAVAALILGIASAQAVEPNTRLDGYRGIWFTIGQDNEWGPKYSGGLGTYTANHVPIAIYAPTVNKTFFLYGGVDDATGDLLIMSSWYDHATCMVPRPTVVYHKVNINDPHDNGALQIDRDGYLWVFISGRASARPGFIYRSAQPYSTDEFQHMVTDQRTYPQPWYLDDGVTPPLFLHMFTKYTAGRELYWATSPDGVNWSPHHKMVGFSGHYQTSMERNGKIATAFNYHPGGSVDRRTNLYYMQTTDRGQTWTTVDGTPLTLPLNQVQNPALVVNYEVQGRLCYINDTNLDEQGNPYILYITSSNFAAGPEGDPRTWTLARWTGQQWVFTEITTSTHNYDVGNLYIEGGTLRIMGPTETGPQQYGTGGEVAMWLSHDLGATWTKVRDVTTGSVYNHSYVRRPRHARDPFYAYWADGNPLSRTDSRLYFANRAGSRVWRLPTHMDGDFARPQRITDFSEASNPTQPLWRSPFETLAIGPVANGQVVSSVRNATGASGTPVGASSLVYAAYGQPTAGTAPAAGAGAFAVSLPDDRSIGINTFLASDAGNLQNALTFEGFFRTPETTPITSPTFVGRRLVTQKRSAGDGETRLAIGLHATNVSGSQGLHDYEGFNYTGTSLDGRTGGIGWGGAWANAVTFTSHLSNDGVSLNSAASPFTPIGSRFSATNGHISRPLSRSIDLTTEGTTTYLSAMLLKTTTANGSAENLEIGLATSATVGATASTIRIGMTSGDQFFIVNSGAPAGSATANVPYFVLIKIVSHAGSPDQCFMNVYGPADTVPAAEPSTWLLSQTLSIPAVLTHLKLTVGAGTVQNPYKGEIDEIRVGSTYASVIDPNAPIASGGGAANVLSVFWHDTSSVNHLEFGATPIQPNTWYHFALVHDGAELKWYLNGNIEGQVTPLNLIPAASGPLSIGNNRLSGENDRGFYGVLDEVRISDQPRAPAEFLVNGGSCNASCGSPGDGVLWCSSFEAEPGVPVTHGLVSSADCGSIENVHGSDGTATGTSSPTYVGYGQPGVSNAPVDAAGAFAMLFPGDASVAVNTHIPSNAGSLEDTLTFEGFFNSSDAAPITAPTSVGRRLVTQKRSELEAESRLAVGLHAASGHNVLAVFWKGQDQANHVELGHTPVQAQTWYHFALVYNAGVLRWYLDGILQGDIQNVMLASAGSAPIVIGNGRGDGVSDRGFYGILDEIRIVDQALGPAGFLKPVATDPEPCHPECSLPFADVDRDGDIDQSDFGEFQACIGGAGSLLLTGSPECLCFDRDGDDAVGLPDFAQFLNCASGPGTLWEPGLTPACAP